ELGTAGDVDRIVTAERHHPTAATHLIVLGRIVHGSHPLMVFQESNDALGVVAVSVHPYGEGLDPAEHQPRVERARNPTHGVLVKAELLSQLVVTHDHRAADHV